MRRRLQPDKNYFTDIGKAAIQEYRRIKNDNKLRIRKILEEAGYDYTIRYTRKEKKRFTRIVKSKLFVNEKPTMLTKEQIKTKNKVKKLAKRIEVKPYMPVVPGKVRGFTAEELNREEIPNSRTFSYTINRKREANPMQNYDYSTDNFVASTKKEAFEKLIPIAKKWKNDSSFAGITLRDPTNGDITYYSTIKFREVA